MAGLLCTAVRGMCNYLSPVWIIRSVLYYKFTYIVCGFSRGINRTKSQFSFAGSLSEHILLRKRKANFGFQAEDYNIAELWPIFSEMAPSLACEVLRCSVLIKPGGYQWFSCWSPQEARQLEIHWLFACTLAFAWRCLWTHLWSSWASKHLDRDTQHEVGTLNTSQERATNGSWMLLFGNLCWRLCLAWRPVGWVAHD